ncbi:MAG: DUF2306 domain-containing protein [Chitinophagales bacterium]
MKNKYVKITQSTIWLALLVYFSYLMLDITLQYIPIQYDVAFLRIKQKMIAYNFYKVAFFTHVFTSMFALIAGFTQFSTFIKKHYPLIHKSMGYVYFIAILGFSAPSGFIMGIFANGGWSSQIAFVLLATFWFGFTFMALRTILQGKVLLHKKYIYFSYALTLSAITLRLWKQGIAYTFAPYPMDLYRIVAWLGWIPNLIIAYLLTKKIKHGKH